MSIARLPYWVLTEKHPAFYDSESKTAVEMVSKVYAKMQELVDEYNKFVDNINKEIENFESSTTNDQKCFEERMTKVIHDYIDYLDSKVANQDKVIAEAVLYMKTNLKTSITELIEQMHESGEFDEAVLNAINNIGDRVVTLETTTSEHSAKIEDLITRVISLEMNHLTTEYVAEDKKLVIYMTNEGGEE